MPDIRTLHYVPKRLRRVKSGGVVVGRIRPGRVANVNEALVIGAQEALPYPAYEVSGDVITPLGAADASEIAANAAIAGVATVANGANPAVFHIQDVAFDAGSSGNLLTVEDAANAFALDLLAGPRTQLTFIDAAGTLTHTSQLLQAPEGTPDNEFVVQVAVDAAAGLSHIHVFYRREAGEPLIPVNYLRAPAATTWANAVETMSFSAAASPTPGIGTAPADGMGTTGDLDFWANSAIA